MEVNGKDCRSEMEISQIMELKMLIQRVKVRGRGAGPEGEGVRKAAGEVQISVLLSPVVLSLKEYENSDLEDEPADISVDVSHYSCTVILF